MLTRAHARILDVACGTLAAIALVSAVIALAEFLTVAYRAAFTTGGLLAPAVTAAGAVILTRVMMRASVLPYTPAADDTPPAPQPRRRRRATTP